ncbi:MAG: hypothetical protein H7A25_23185 [Leptospiraceae bacterium]|nr:hypothetical protein [Leptospiraceae bacterium]MCP5502823.1 hypothetical protein [Leptospiraceae bacterium]
MNFWKFLPLITILVFFSFSNFELRSEDLDFLDKVMEKKPSAKKKKKSSKEGEVRKKKKKKPIEVEEPTEVVDEPESQASENNGWIREDIQMNEKFIPGYGKVYQNLPDEGTPGKETTNPDKIEKKEEPTTKEPKNRDSVSTWDTILSYKKYFLVFGIILLFAVYRWKFAKNKGNSPGTIRRYKN